MKIIPLSEGSFTVDKTKVFQPFDIAKDKLSERPVGSLLVEVQPFAVITSRDIILIDTGLGFFENGELQIHANLKKNGISPADVTKVLMSHLHKDHAGGIAFRDQAGNSNLAFTEATYYIQEKELDYAVETASPSFAKENFALLLDNPAVKLLDDSGVIDEYILFKTTGGHSPFHQVFWIEEDSDVIFFGGDVAPQLQQMKSRFAAKYDYDGKKSMELRRDWWQKGQEGNWKFLFYHDIKNPVWPLQ